MHADAAAPIDAARDRWMDVCGASAFLSFLLILGYVVCPPVLGVTMPYAGGGAVVLGIGATICLRFVSRSTRLAAAIVLIGLMSLRTLSAIRPDLIIAEHGPLSLWDGGALVLLILAAASMLGVAMGRPSSWHSSTQQPTSSPSGPRG